MSFRELFPYVTGAGGALAVLLYGLWLFVTGRVLPRTVHDKIILDKDRQIIDLSQAVLRERERADSAVLAAQTTKDILQALHREVKS